jgi:hypothetical protein
MSRVVLTHEGTVLKEFVLSKDRTSIGRKPQNDIRLDDPTVSGEHAVILMLQNYYIEDMNSTNGVILNGKKVTRRQLNHGDMIRIGRHELKFLDDNAEDFENTVIIRPESGDKGSAPSVKAKSYEVTVMSGHKQGESILLSKPYTTLGKPGVQVAVVARRGKEFYLMPMTGTGSSGITPPLLNGAPVSVTSQKLTTGDEIEVASVKLRFGEVQ